MKKVVILLFCILLLLTGCSKAENQSFEGSFRAGVLPTKFWEDEKIEDSPYCVIPNVDVAVKIATDIYENLPNNLKAQKFDAQSVFYDEEDAVWVVLFRKAYTESGPDFTGPCYAIALQKKDGKVLGIQVG